MLGQVNPSGPAAGDLHSHGNPGSDPSDAGRARSGDGLRQEGTARERRRSTFRRMPGCPPGTPLDLDTRELKIERVTAGPADDAMNEVRFELGEDRRANHGPRPSRNWIGCWDPA